jgi:drug/metabolite transporter (DMT)-like permease
MLWKARINILLLLLAAVLALSVGETLLAKGMKGLGGAATGWKDEILRALLSPWVWAGGILLLVHLVFYMAALGKADLSYVLPLLAASYPLTSLLAQIYLHERVSPTRWLGTVLITAGVAVVGFGDAVNRH